MLFQSLIERKRDGHPLEPGEWSALVADYMAGRIPDYQISALLMAVVWRGLEPAELAALTDAMLASGRRLDFGDWTTPRIDKHSTGGVGDKVSLVLAPLVASCGLAVPMMSGRGLGHTGGTVDKLESIPGFRTDLDLAEAEAQVRRIGCAMLRQTTDMAPADARLYALRDVTGTIESIPLIAASIMSKKLAEGLSGLVLDVKTGSGAFMRDTDRAVDLAQTMIGLGEARGCRTTALVTAMDRPLGRACGNALEVEEALLALEGKGPPDLMEVTRALGVEMLLAGGITTRQDTARKLLDEKISSGAAMDTFRRVIEAQGGNPAVIDDPGILPQAGAVEIFEAPARGFVAGVEPRIIGRAIVEMGGGRRTVDDVIDPSVGFVITVKPGDQVTAGEPIASVFAHDSRGIEIGLQALSQAIRLGEQRPPTPLILKRVTAKGVEPPGGSTA
jgi:pyrimidine-nucleoside phosphorylase